MKESKLTSTQLKSRYSAGYSLTISHKGSRAEIQKYVHVGRGRRVEGDGGEVTRGETVRGRVLWEREREGN